MSKSIRKVWTFQSESNASKTYETLQYDDDTTSCNCPGWTRRTAMDGSRSCKHTRLVDQGLADSQCASSHDYSAGNAPAKPAPIQTPSKQKPATKPVVKSTVPQRKIRWQ